MAGPYRTGQYRFRTGDQALVRQINLSVIMHHIYPELVTGSSLVPLGDTVLAWPDDYVALTELLLAVDQEYADANPALGRFVLDYEYKQVAPGALVVKQVRPLPLHDPDATWPVNLVNEPGRFCVFQGESGDVFANHRLISRWDLSTRNLWLTAQNLAASFYADAALEYAETCQVYDQTGSVPGWPFATHGFAAGTAADGFRPDHGDRLRQLRHPSRMTQ